ncbi:unnamed protein product [Cuscuta campestris]|uniref:Uncharacterized protein n=1 Tax=Cuscuta campestris TaxID=132261 RepID=A0A484N1S6_9ASTE|nr:unnamed protein product [Cuscuta campestris]
MDWTWHRGRSIRALTSSYSHFGKVVEDYYHLDPIIKRAVMRASSSVVSIITQAGKELLHIGSGTIIEYDEHYGCATVLTSASLLQAPGVAGFLPSDLKRDALPLGNVSVRSPRRQNVAATGSDDSVTLPDAGASSPFQPQVVSAMAPVNQIGALNVAGPSRPPLQRESENITQFLTWWKDEVDKVEEMDDKTVFSLLLNGLHAGNYTKSSSGGPCHISRGLPHGLGFAEAETQDPAKKEAEHGHKPKGKLSRKLKGS